MQIKAGDHHSDHDAIVSAFNLVFFAETHHGNHAGCRVHTRPPFQNYVELECTQSLQHHFHQVSSPKMLFGTLCILSVSSN